MSDVDSQNTPPGLDTKCQSEEQEIYSPRPWWQLVILGFFTGSGGALIGVGGGIIMVPVLCLWGLGQKRAQGTSLTVILALVPIAILMYGVLGGGNIDFHFAIPLAVGGVIGSIFGSRLALRFSNRILSIFFGIFLFLIALNLLINPPMPDLSDQTAIKTWIEYAEASLFGILAGLAAGFFGVGGGVVFVPAGVLLGGLTQVCAQGSSFTAMLPTSFVGVLNYRINDQIDWNFVRWMIPGAWLGVLLGSYLAAVVPGDILRIIFSLMLIYTAVRRIIVNRGLFEK